MLRQRKPIRTVSYMPLTADGNIVMCLNDMTDEQRNYVGQKIAEKFINVLYSGKMEVKAILPPPEAVFPQLAEYINGGKSG